MLRMRRCPGRCRGMTLIAKDAAAAAAVAVAEVEAVEAVEAGRQTGDAEAEAAEEAGMRWWLTSLSVCRSDFFIFFWSAWA
jgi:hypothetical protein